MSSPVPGIADQADLDLTWLGTAGFRVRAGAEVFLIDPYLSRNPEAQPNQPLHPGDIREGKRIFISHGHFDHLADVPRIAANLGSKVFCDRVAAETLVREGLDQENIVTVEQDGQKFDFSSFIARANFSRHIKFDIPLVLKTLIRANIRFFKLKPLLKLYPPGQVLAWRFDLGGRSILHFGSAGSTKEELQELAKVETDILLVPLQGHTNICEIALEYVRMLRPRLVIPHHQDDFYPPVSQMVDIDPFLSGLRRESPTTEVIVPKMNEPIFL
jgi:L-ascorbate metabolism protein UlaG (beta-lactamase superfamily)